MTTLESLTQSPRERPLPDGWRWVRLGDVCLEDRCIVESRSKEAIQLPYLSLEHIEANTGRILRHSQTAVEDEGLSTTFLFTSAHVLYGKLRPYLNKVALPDFEGRCTTEIIPLRANDRITRDFLALVLRRQESVDYAMQGKTGSRMPRADMNQLLSLNIPLPPLSEQKRIAEVLRRQMAAVAKARAAAQARLEAISVLPAACLRSVFEGPDATHWPMRPLGEVLVPHKEIIHPGDRQNGTAIFVGLEHIESHTGRRIGSASLDLARLTGRKPTFRQGQIVYGYLRPYLNKVWIAEFDGCSSVDQFAYGVRSDLVDVRFVAWFMRSPTYMRRSQVVTTTGQLPRIGTGEIAAVGIGLPSLDVQRAVADEIDRRFEAHQRFRNLLIEEAEAIEGMPAALLRQVFLGKQ